jgi:hypothetical protein
MTLLADTSPLTDPLQKRVLLIVAMNFILSGVLNIKFIAG